MKEMLRKKLNNVKDLEQRRALKELIEEVLLPMAENQEEKWSEITGRVVDEIRPQEEPYEIVMGLCDKADYDPVHSHLFPILPPEKPNLSGMEAALKETRGPVVLFSVYINETWEKVLGILSDPPIFDAVLLTADGTSVNGVCRLIPDTGYADALRDVYRSFIKNGLPWNTVNTAHIDRMASVELTGWDEFPKDAKLSEIDVKFGTSDCVFLTDMIPLWNIVRLEMKCSGAIFPMEDSVTFEHYIEIEESEAEHGYLISAGNEDVQSVRRESSALVIRTNDAKGKNPDVYKIVRPHDLQMDTMLRYPPFSNRRRLLFTDMLANRAMNVFTYAEAMRIIESHSLPVTVRDIGITDKKYPPHTRGTMNLVLDDAFSHINDSKILCVSFEAEENAEYSQDMIRFLMSELQMYFPVYLCVGVIV
jgi:hypothetical protein